MMNECIINIRRAKGAAGGLNRSRSKWNKCTRGIIVVACVNVTK